MSDLKYSGPTIRKCSPTEVFELPVYKYFLVLDTRSDTSGKVIWAAHRLPEGEDCAKDVKKFLDMLELKQLWPDQWKYMVVYDNGEISEYTKMVAENVKQYLVAGANTPGHDKADLFATVEEIWLLDGGYPAYEAWYSTYSGVLADDLLPSPCVICPFVYMASRGMDFSAELIEECHFTHIVCDNETEVPPSADVVKLQLPLANDEDLVAALTPTYQFIRAVQQPGNRTLVKFGGQTQSATIIAAYLMRLLNKSAADAVDYIRKRQFRGMDRSLIPFDALEEWGAQEIEDVPSTQ